MPPDARYYFTQPDSPRALKAAKLTAEAQSVGLKGQCYEKLADALTDALNNADKRDVVFVGGSNYLVGEFLAINKLS
jgi:dihydrofolate synthase/folylpolyglutamate synthase